MRDLLPEDARSRRCVVERALEAMGLFGYFRVTPPAFEFAEVLERGLGTLDPRDVLRFVEPESGEVAALRPDMTPQIARMIATRLRERPPPFRLAYEGTVLRRRSGRARKSRQMAQVGVELAGLADLEGDLEVLGVAAATVKATGLRTFTVDIGDSRVVRSLLPSDVPDVVMQALARKDDFALREARAQVGDHYETLARLLHLSGGAACLKDAQPVVAGTPAEGPVAALSKLYERASTRLTDVGATLSVDLAEVRGFAYYTGMTFHVYAEGPGEAVGAGGRYDELLGRFGAPMPAVGFALDVDGLVWARRSVGLDEAGHHGVVVVGAPDDPRLLALRAKGTPAVASPSAATAETYRAAWGFAKVLDGEEV
jgi:ATP phosphoribosyltransferase regulatory subunit